jgi:Phage derived protein Gp49-like (DUF891)
MGLWTFLEFYSEAGNNLIEEWYLTLDPSAQADFDTTLKHLSISPDWEGIKEFKHLDRAGLCEIRFTTANVQYRPLGFFGPGERTFSILAGATNKQRVYNSPHACDLAIKRYKSLKQGKGTLHERIV